MNKRVIKVNDTNIAIIESDELVITDTQSALDLMSTIKFYDDCDHIAVYKNIIIEDFFILSSGLAGEILQKFVNYSSKLAIIGDFSIYTSKPLHDFIYESNSGNDIFFVSSEEEAIKRLSTTV